MVCLQGTQETRMDAEKIELKPFLISLFLLALAEGGRIAILPHGKRLSTAALAVIGGIRIFELALFLVTFSLWGNGLKSIGLARDQIFPGIKRGLIWSAGFGFIVSIGFGALLVLGQNPLEFFRAPLPETAGALSLFFLVGGLIAPVVEEVFFRGILYGFFRKWGVIPALLVSTALFILAHPGASITQSVGGIIFALAYEREGKLMVPITIHAIGNSALFTLSLLARM